MEVTKALCTLFVCISSQVMCTSQITVTFDLAHVVIYIIFTRPVTSTVGRTITKTATSRCSSMCHRTMTDFIGCRRRVPQYDSNL